MHTSLKPLALAVANVPMLQSKKEKQTKSPTKSKPKPKLKLKPKPKLNPEVNSIHEWVRLILIVTWQKALRYAISRYLLPYKGMYRCYSYIELTRVKSI